MSEISKDESEFYVQFGASSRYHDLTVPQFKDFIGGIYKHPTLAADYKIWQAALAHRDAAKPSEPGSLAKRFYKEAQYCEFADDYTVDADTLGVFLRDCTALESQRDQLAAEVERLKKVAKQATQGMFIHGVTGKYTIHRDGHDIRVDNAFELGNYLTTKGCSKGEL